MASRQIILDTETTGLSAKMGDRVIEIGCIELLSRNVTERSFQCYLNPERDIEEGAAKVHGVVHSGHSNGFSVATPVFAKSRVFRVAMMRSC